MNQNYFNIDMLVNIRKIRYWGRVTLLQNGLIVSLGDVALI